MKLHKITALSLLLAWPTITFAAYSPNNPNGQAASANSAPVVMASDQSAINAVTTQIISPSTTYNYTSAVTAASTQVTPGGWYSICVQIPSITASNITVGTSCTGSAGQNVVTLGGSPTTTGVAIGQSITGTGIPIGARVVSFVANTSIMISCNITATVSGSVVTTHEAFTATVQSSPDNSTWSSMSVIPKTLLTQSSPTSTLNGEGLWIVRAPSNVNYIRVNITTMTNCTANVFVDSYSQGSVINLPLKYTATQANWTAGACIIPPIDTSNLADETLDVTSFGGIGQTISFLGSNDPSLAIAQPVSASYLDQVGSPSASSLTALHTAVIAVKQKYFYAKETGTSITAFTIGGATARVSISDCSVVTPSLLGTNLMQVAGTATVTGGLAGTIGVGGSVANGTAPTSYPIPLARDVAGLTRFLTTTEAGGVTGPGEVVALIPAFTAGSTTPADGTNSKTYQSIPGRECDVYFGCVAQGNGADTIQVEGSYDAITFSVIPMSRIDNLASSQQFAFSAAFTPTTGAVYRGKSYGYAFIRVHQTAFTTTGTNGVLRISPVHDLTGLTTSAFSLSATNTTEAAGSANGAVQTGGVRTLTITSKGACKAIMQIDANTGTNSVALEGSTDGGTTFNILPMQPLGGGSTTTSAISFTGTAALPTGGVWEADASNMTNVRVHCTAWTSGAVHGALKIVNVANAAGLGNPIRAAYTAAVTGVAPTTSTNVMVIESGSAKTVRLKRIFIQPGTATAAGIATLTLQRNTVAASASGTAQTPSAHDTTDSAFTGLCRTGAFTLAGVTTTSTTIVFTVPTPISTAANPAIPLEIDFTDHGNQKGIQIPVGVTNGLMFTHSGLSGAAGFGLTVDFTEE